MNSISARKFSIAVLMAALLAFVALFALPATASADADSVTANETTLQSEDASASDASAQNEQGMTEESASAAATTSENAVDATIDSTSDNASGTTADDVSEDAAGASSTSTTDKAANGAKAATVGINAESENATINATGSSNDSTAYVVITTDGKTMTFVRSTEQHQNHSSGFVTSINGTVYPGNIYTGFENNVCYWAAGNEGLPDTPWYQDAAGITTVNFDDPIVPDNTACWFDGFTNLTTINFNGNLDTSNVQSFANMFTSCTSLQSVDLSKLNTSSGMDFIGMFANAPALTSLDVSSWDMTSATDIYGMFWGCTSLESIEGLENWKTINVRSMRSLFYDCTNLTSADVGNWDVSNVEDFSWMFAGCSSLTSLDLSTWDTSRAKYMQGVFSGCTSLASLNVVGWDTSHVRLMSYLFENCTSLTSLDLSSFDTSYVWSIMEGVGRLPYYDDPTDAGMHNFFDGANNLRSVTLGTAFAFNGNGYGDASHTTLTALLPTPQGEGYTGNWVRDDGTLARSAESLRDTYDGATMAGTWVWETGSSTTTTTDTDETATTPETTGVSYMEDVPAPPAKQDSALPNTGDSTDAFPVVGIAVLSLVVLISAGALYLRRREAAQHK